MASELKVDKFTGVTTAGSILVTGEGNSTTTNLQQGLAKFWINLEGASTTSDADLVGVNDSFNATSVVDNGTGSYTSSFTNAMNNANYSIVLTHEHGDAGGQTSNAYFQTIATGSFISHNEGVSSGSNTSHGARDFAVCGQVTGDLA